MDCGHHYCDIRSICECKNTHPDKETIFNCQPYSTFLPGLTFNLPVTSKSGFQGAQRNLTSSAMAVKAVVKCQTTVHTSRKIQTFNCVALKKKHNFSWRETKTNCSWLDYIFWAHPVSLIWFGSSLTSASLVLYLCFIHSLLKCVLIIQQRDNEETCWE